MFYNKEREIANWKASVRMTRASWASEPGPALGNSLCHTKETRAGACLVMRVLCARRTSVRLFSFFCSGLPSHNRWKVLCDIDFVVWCLKSRGGNRLLIIDHSAGGWSEQRRLAGPEGLETIAHRSSFAEAHACIGSTDSRSEPKTAKTWRSARTAAARPRRICAAVASEHATAPGRVRRHTGSSISACV